MSGIAIAWTVVGIAAAVFVGWGVGVMGIASPDYLQARVAFTLAAVTLGAMTLVWAARSEEPAWWRMLASVLVGIGVFVLYPEGLRWTYRLESKKSVEERVVRPLKERAQILSSQILAFVAERESRRPQSRMGIPDYAGGV
ncbi:MAG: hypothetical protein QOF63_2894, partial [Thermoanaerobaculia bacterium]|nr:hypothetical protein [Thermoanaerobaculia bacterium]